MPIFTSRVAAELRSAVQHLAVEDAADQLPKLSRDIDSVQLLAGAYGDAVAPRENWQELQRAIEHDDRSVFEYFRRRRWLPSRSGCIVENDNYRPWSPYDAAFSAVTALADGR